MKLLIGSRALAYWKKDFQLKPNADWDIISDEPIEGAEWHKPDFLNNATFENFTNVANVNFNGHKLYVVDMWGLSIIKRSHLWRNLSFQKHVTHYHKYMQFVKRQQYDSFMENVLQERTALTMQAFPQGHPSLKKSVDEFFDDYVTKKYDHDYLHELVAYYDKPLYTQLQRDSSSAWCDRDLWDNLSIEDRTKCVAEETQVIAIERFLVPKDWNYPVRHAYLKSLDKVCTTLCSGWFRDHAIDYYPEVMQLCDTMKFENIRKELENGNS
jgi:hypothetical protein